MWNIIQRVLIGWVLLALVLLVLVDDTYASVHWDGNSGSALAHCEQTSQAEADRRNASSGYFCGGTPAGSCPTACTLTNSVSYSGCVGGCVGSPGPAYRCTTRSQNGEGPAAQCEATSQGIYGYHAYDPLAAACETTPGTSRAHWYDFGSGAPGSVCQDSCAYQVAGDTGECQYEDTNGNGFADAGEQIMCEALYTATGDDCNSGNQINDTPGGGPYFDCTNVQCGSDSPPGGGSGETGGGPDLPAQDPPTPPTGGDGNPDTPNAPGHGGGDVDGDGERDIDCNPLSNPDCNFVGSGSGAADCTVQPLCGGDPVQCAILYQQWAAMCYDGGQFTNPRSCEEALVCEGDVLMCELLRQQRQQYCDLWVGDETFDGDPTNNADFERDLKEEGTEIDLPDQFDMAGLGSGSCPADIAMNTSLGSVSISFALICQVAPIIRILVIMSALIMGAFIVIGSPGRGGS